MGIDRYAGQTLEEILRRVCIIGTKLVSTVSQCITAMRDRWTYDDHFGQLLR